MENANISPDCTSSMQRDMSLNNSQGEDDILIDCSNPDTVSTCADTYKSTALILLKLKQKYKVSEVSLNGIIEEFSSFFQLQIEKIKLVLQPKEQLGSYLVQSCALAQALPLLMHCIWLVTHI